MSTPETNAAIEAENVDPWDLAADLERRLTTMTAQRDAAWATIAAIKKDFIEDESFGKTVETLFGEPLEIAEQRIVGLERRLTVAREALETVSRLPIAGQYPDGPCIERSDMAEILDALKQTAPKP